MGQWFAPGEVKIQSSTPQSTPGEREDSTAWTQALRTAYLERMETPERLMFEVKNPIDYTRFFVVTHDGWHLAVHRYRPQRTTIFEPVLLVHGLGKID